ncbi:MAG: hypothetical protein AABO41_11140 [Acidobacteriota bacterium]
MMKRFIRIRASENSLVPGAIAAAALAVLVVTPLLLCIAAPAQGRGSGSGEVTGTLKLQIGKETRTAELKYVYAEAYKRTGGLFITFTDQPLPDDPVERWRYVELMSAEGKLHAVRLYLKPSWALAASAVYRPITTSPYFDSGRFLDDTANEEYDPKAGQMKPGKNEYEEVKLRVVPNQTVEGTIRSRLLGDDGPAYADTKFQYQVKFKAPITPESASAAKTLPEGGGEPGKAYLAFYGAVMTGDLEKIKKAVTVEQAKMFEGANARKRVTKLKALLLPLKQVVGSSYATFVSNSGRFARVTITEDVQFVKKYWTEAKLNHTPPAPLTTFALSELPWDPQNHMPAPRGFNRMPQTAYARLILDGGQWKIDWLLLYCEPVNLFWHLDDYQTMEERYEAYEKNRPVDEAAESESDAEMFEIENGAPLTAGGGEAGKAYLEFCAAEKAGNKQAVLKYLRGEQAAFYADPALTITRGAFIWKESSSLDYVGIRVVSGASDGARAVLNVQAVRQGRNSTGKVLMVLEARQWKVDIEKWQTDAATKPAPRNRR